MIGDRRIAGITIHGRSGVIFLLLMSIGLADVDGRKCICTSKVCKELGVDTCKTKYFCYTELIMKSDEEVNEDATTRGCTEGATPLLCETKSWISTSNSSGPMPWAALKCCNSHDYCNGDDRLNLSSWRREKEGKKANSVGSSVDLEHAAHDPPGRSGKAIAAEGEIARDYGGPADQLHLQHRVRPLHVAAFVLAIAALLSVLAACYVITRFLKSYPYTVGRME